MSEYRICTIIAKNYVAFARTLCESFLARHPDGECHVLIIDDYRGYIDPAMERFRVVDMETLGIQDLREFRFRYNLIELATACKPFLLEHLLSRGAERIIYLDPDILVTNPLDRMYDMLDVADIIVTPHLDRDFPDDGHLPDDSIIMTHGVFNLGFIGVRKCENTFRFLEWWRKKLRFKCLIDYKKGYFVDQKFMDLALTLFGNIRIIADPGYNVSYWNLHSRKISRVRDEWRCNDGPLYFYHFSNYRPDRPETMSSHQDRFNLAGMPDLRALHNGYAAAVEENGYATAKKWPYTFNSFSNGEPINDLIRRYCRSRAVRKELGDPFNIGSYSLMQRILFILMRLYKRCTRFILRYGRLS